MIKGVHRILPARAQNDNDNPIGTEGDDILRFVEFTGTVQGNGGNDVLKFASYTAATVYGGTGDDVIDLVEWRSGWAHSLVVDGGSDRDTLALASYNSIYSDFDWSAIRDIEQITLFNYGDRRMEPFFITDAMFNTVDSLTVSARAYSRGQAMGSSSIDASGVTLGTLNMVGFDRFHDTLLSGSGNDTLLGFAGDDELSGGGGDDVLDGGKGADIAIFSGQIADYSITRDAIAGTVTVTNTVGDDGTDVLTGIERLMFSDRLYFLGPVGPELTGTARADSLIGTNGSDSIHGRGGNDFLDGGLGDNSIAGEGGDDRILGGRDTDTLLGGAGKDDIRDKSAGRSHGIIDGGAGDDTVVARGGHLEVLGGSGNDRLDMQNVTGTVDGGDGNDRILFWRTGSEGSPFVLTVLGGEGDDNITGAMRSGIDVQGGNGNDRLEVKSAYSEGYSIDLGEGIDILATTSSWEGRLNLAWAAIHNVEIIALVDDGSHSSEAVRVELHDEMFAYQDSWIIDAEREKHGPSTGRFEIDGSSIDDGTLLLIGRSGKSDTLIGGSREDTLLGLSGGDSLFGGEGDDSLSGGDGNDQLTGDAGSDYIDGGAGNDFAFFDGDYADYSVEILSDRVVVTALDDTGDVDTLINIEALRFDDRLMGV